MTARVVRYSKDKNAQFAGTKIQVWEVIRAINNGAGLVGLAAKFPRLTMLDIDAAYKYYDANHKEIDGIIQRKYEAECANRHSN